MKTKDTVNLYRFFSIFALVLVTYSFCCLLSLSNPFSLDEWICVISIATVFLLIYIFELEYERLKGGLAFNTQSNYARVVIMFTISAAISLGLLNLPMFCRPVMIVTILVASVSNQSLAILTGLFFDVLLGIAGGGDFYVLVGMCFLTMFGGVLSEALKEKRLRIWIVLLMFFVNLLIPCVFHYFSTKELNRNLIPYWLFSAVVTAVCAFFAFAFIWRETRNEVENLYMDILSDDYSEVKGLKDFSMYEYERAKRVADICYRCASQVGLKENLCRAAGFYYRMSRWLGEPYHKNVYSKARALCFPDELTQILLEYYGEEQKMQTPESALVHMVDALTLKMDIMKNEVGVEKSQWNRDILIYQTLNEYSSAGLYDHCGMSMNLFLKVREFLAREEMLL